MEKKLLKDVERLEKQPFGSSEASVLRGYLDICVELPWNKTTKERVDITVAKRILDNDHYGLEKVKERIIEFLAVKQLAPDIKGPILCLVGPPGVGKTSVAISVAKALNRQACEAFAGWRTTTRPKCAATERPMSVRCRAELSPQSIKRVLKNPLMLLDEIDKIGADYRGDPAAALLEALDPEQNSSFRDHFLEVPFDLSEVLFITTANTTSTIPRPLLDRMEVIELSSYTDLEKLEIAKRHLIPKQRKKHGLSAKQFKISDDAIREIIACYTRESGVRLLEREIAAACRKTAAKIAEGELLSVNIKTGMLETYLGVRKYKPENLSLRDEAGIARGLAWTSMGGGDPRGGSQCAGGDRQTRSHRKPGRRDEGVCPCGCLLHQEPRGQARYLTPISIRARDIHIHFPEGAIPKDGPSAGITMAIAVISALTNVPVRREIAMTGEITLRGRILPIGGLKEKTMAALRSGVKTVIIPADNEKDLQEIDQSVRRSLNFVTSDHIDSILDVALDFTKAKPAEKPIELPAPIISDSKESVPSQMALRQ